VKEEEAEKRREKEEDMRERKKTSELRWPVMSLFHYLEVFARYQKIHTSPIQCRNLYRVERIYV
jgi:hypothetical protein